MATDREAYDIASILHQMELDLIASQRRTLALHLAAEREEGFKWEQWQTRKLEALRALKIEHGKIVTKYGRTVRGRIMRLLSGAFIGQANAVEALFRSARPFIGKPGLDDRNFFGINQPKLQALIDAVDGEHRAAESATLRLMDDQYRQTLYRTQVYYNTGSVSLGQAIDMASKEFLAAGIRSIQYRNGARVNIASYSEMAIRTAKVRAQAIAQGAVMDDWGEHLVKVRSLGSTCELCAPWQGRVMIDDVWASGTSDEGEYPMVSSAVSSGLGHPNCRHIPINPWFPDINEPEKRPTAEENEQIIKNFEAEQKQREIERNIRKYKRLETGSIDPDNRAAYGAKVKEWQGRMREHLADNPQLRRIPMRESANFSVSVPPKQLKNVAAERKWNEAGFASKKLAKRHYEKHGSQYPGLDEQQYLQVARDLLTSEDGDNVISFDSELGFLVKYRRSTNDFAIGRPDGQISTVYKPDNGEQHFVEERLKNGRKT
jgi:Phage minor capsid protein 2.